MVTFAPTTAAPEGSLMVPVMLPKTACPKLIAGNNARHNPTHNRMTSLGTWAFMGGPPDLFQSPTHKAGHFQGVQTAQRSVCSFLLKLRLSTLSPAYFPASCWFSKVPAAEA